MKLTLQHINVRSTDQLDSMVEERILAFEPELRIDAARVRLECRWQQSPAFRVAVHIVTPGPDLEVEACDHTLRAALGKAMAALEEKLRWRKRKPLRRLRSNLQAPPARHAASRG